MIFIGHFKSSCIISTEFSLYFRKKQKSTSQGIFQKKSVSGSWMLPLVIFDKKVFFFPEIVLFYGSPGKTTPKVPFFKDSGCCPKILDYALLV